MFNSDNPASLFSHLILYYLISFYGLLLLSFVTVYAATISQFNSEADIDHRDDLAEYSRLFDAGGIDRIAEEVNYEALAGEQDLIFRKIFDAQGNQSFTSDMENWSELPLQQETIAAQHNPNSEPVIAAVTIPSHDSEIRIIYGALSPDFVFVSGESQEERDNYLSVLISAFSSVFVFSVPVCLTIAWVLSHRATNGIQVVARAVHDLEQGDFSRRLHVAGQPAEVQKLADSFDSMADRISHLVKNMQILIDNLAHDLRSPLGRIRLHCENLQNDRIISDVHQKLVSLAMEECDRVIHLINTSLDVSETEAGVGQQETKIVSVAHIVEDAVELFEPVAELNELEINIAVSGAGWVRGNLTSLQRAMSNILDNAIKYTPAGEKVFIELSESQSWTVVSTRNTGVGISKEDAVKIFDRFYRVDESRTNPGCGLGLSYARAVARSHGGDLTVKSKHHEFTEFVLSLPTVA